MKPILYKDLQRLKRSMDYYDAIHIFAEAFRKAFLKAWDEKGW